MKVLEGSQASQSPGPLTAKAKTIVYPVPEKPRTSSACLGCSGPFLSPPLPQSWGSSVRALTGKRSAGKQTELVTAGVHIHLFN